MKAAVEYLVLYAALFLTGFPFLFFCANFVWCRLKGTWAWNRKRRLLLLNSAIYPVVFVLICVALIQLFGVGEELQRETDQMVALNRAAVREGAEPRSHNYLLGAIFFAVLYFGAALIPATAVGLAYSVASTTILLRSSADSGWVQPLLVSSLICVFVVLFGFVFRTPIFNAVSLIWAR